MSKPLITIGDGTDRQVTVFRSRSGSLCFEFWDTDVSNACVDYDWESTQVFVEKDEEDKLFQELLKRQDRSALLSHLLAAEGLPVEVRREDEWDLFEVMNDDEILAFAEQQRIDKIQEIWKKIEKARSFDPPRRIQLSFLDAAWWAESLANQMKFRKQADENAEKWNEMLSINMRYAGKLRHRLEELGEYTEDLEE